MNTISTEEFISRFFSRPNILWPGQDPDTPVANSMQPFLPALTERGECPLVLPRRDTPQQAAFYYVICWDVAHAGRIRALLEAAVSAHWTPFDGRVARLNPQDPVEAAVLALVGPGSTFLVRPEEATASHAYRALARLARSLGGVPLRNPAPPRPIGRMLREFDVALATGAAESSARILSEIQALGGISHENVAFLQIRRLARLGRDADLLSHASLPTLVYVEPPLVVREGILGAWIRTLGVRPIVETLLEGAIDSVREARPDIAMLVDERLARTFDPDAATVGALVALARGDGDLARAFASNKAVDDAVHRRLLQMDRIGATSDAISLAYRDQIAPVEIAEEEASVVAPPEVLEAELPGAGALGDAAVETEAVAEVDIAADPPEVETPSIGSWIEWARAIGQGRLISIDSDLVGSWLPVATVDNDFAQAIDDVGEIGIDDLLLGTACFLDADEYDRPAPRSAEALLRRYHVAERFGPADLAAICALLEVFLRGGPSGPKYREVLSDIRSFSDQWVAIATASRALDIADAVALGPAADAVSRVDFVTAMLLPLNNQKRRLDEGFRSLADLVTSDVGLDLDWTVPDPEEDGPKDVTATAVKPRVLLYSLDTGTLARVAKAIEVTWPGSVVRTSSDKDGSPMLKRHARNSDLIVVATRRAAHAATDCITDNAGATLIRYPDGAGSASMLRAVTAGLAELASK